MSFLRRRDALFMFFPFAILMLVVLAPLIPQLIGGTHDTGVCVFKGPAFYSTGLLGGTTSTGVPLRGIPMEAWHSGSFGIHATDSVGRTDRMGCFTYKVAWGTNEYFTYNYNGTSYTDQASSGTILQDNVP